MFSRYLLYVFHSFTCSQKSFPPAFNCWQQSGSTGCYRFLFGVKKWINKTDETLFLFSDSVFVAVAGGFKPKVVAHFLSVKYLCSPSGTFSLMWFSCLSRTNTGEEAFRKSPPPTSTTASCGRHLATGSTTVKTCFHSLWKMTSLHWNQWTAPVTGKFKASPSRLHMKTFHTERRFVAQFDLFLSGLSATAWCSATGLAHGESFLWGWQISGSCTGTSCQELWLVWPECGASSRMMLTFSAWWIRSDLQSNLQVYCLQQNKLVKWYHKKVSKISNL